MTGLAEGSEIRGRTVLAFDPGGTTGWCLASWDAQTKVIYNQHFGQFDLPDHHTDLGRFIEYVVDRHQDLMVVAEDYRMEFARAQNPIALEYIGVMSYICRRNVVPFERQDRSIKTFWTSDRLRRTHFWPKSQPHAQDAARHWLAYACKQDRDLETELMDRIR